MNKVIIIAWMIAIAMAVSCSHEKGAYIDLTTGKSINVEKDPVTSTWINADTKEPVYIYVDREKHDSIYAKTGEVINGHIILQGDRYWYDQDLEREYNVQTVNYNKKVENVGDIKIKRGNVKIKIEDGKRKVKYDD
jgi:lipoprotein-anchoring transpeptidase ErfK/SrfK